MKKNPGIYSCNVYLVRGTWNRISDMNTLIDVGTDGFIVEELEEINTGVGKSKIDQIVLTHEHFDHAGGLKYIQGLYKPKVFAFTNLEGVTDRIKDGYKLRIGDKDAVVLYTPGHTNDSVCIYCEEEGALFSGDTTLNINSTMGTYSRTFLKVIERLTRLNIKTIYPGHELPITEGAKEMLKNSYRNILKSKILD